jgi:hypothetical protein
VTDKLTPGQARDGRSAADMLDTLGGGDVLLADRACDSDALRLEMAARGAWLPCSRQTRFSQNLDALYESVS